MSGQPIDPTVQRLRGEISEVDQAILDVVNARIALVADLRRHKEGSCPVTILPPNKRSHRLVVRTLASHAGSRGSNPLGTTK